MRGVIAYYILIAGCAFAADPDPAHPDQAMLAADKAFVDAANHSNRAARNALLDAGFTSTPKEWSHLLDAGKAYTYGALGDVQANQGRMHQLRVWAKRTAGWKLIVYQEVLSLEAPPTVTPGAGKDCENPCKMVPYQPKNATEHAVIAAYSRLETAAMAHNSPVFATLVADEFIAASSNSNKLYDKRGRMQDFDRAKMSGVAPTPLVSAQFDDFGDAVLMRSRHMPDVGHPLRVTRIWVRRDGRWMEAVSYQTSITDQ